MRITQKVPQAEPVMVEINKKNRMYKWYEVVPKLLGEMQYHGVRTWVSDDGLTFRSKDDVLEYFRRRESGKKTLDPGSYTLDVETVIQQPSRLVIRTRSGDEVVINFESASPNYPTKAVKKAR